VADEEAAVAAPGMAKRATAARSAVTGRSSFIVVIVVIMR
jgi:hypothetical protein